jgi:hypothetical protein
MKKVLTAAVLAACSLSALADDFSYKGLHAGAAEAEVRERLPDYMPSALRGAYRYRDSDGCLKMSGAGSDAMQQCSRRVSIGGAEVQEGSIYTTGGVVTLIDLSIYGGGALKLESSLTDAYGKPAKEDRPIFKNKMGGELQGYMARWESDNSVMTYFRDGDKLNTLRIMSKAEDAKRQGQEHQRAKAGAKDF